MTTEVTNVVQGKWGFYPCSRETYLKLKKLNFYYMQAQKQAATWFRWARKLDKNRAGNEPSVNPVFTKFVPVGSQKWAGTRSIKTVFADKEQETYYFLIPNKYEKKTGKWGDYYAACGHNSDNTILINSRGIPRAYQMARIPRKDEKEVSPLVLSIESIDLLLAECESWELSRKKN
jgi:hypothetical protein